MKIKLKQLVCLLSAVIFTSQVFSQAWIRVNQMGYLPGDIKVAVFLSKDPVDVSEFRVREALTDKVIAAFSNVKSYGSYPPFSSSYRLDFSSYTNEGAVYIEAGGIRSPVFNVSNSVYDGSADFLLRYMRQQRCGYNPFLKDSCHTHDGYIIYHPTRDSMHIDVTGGWHDATDYLQYTATSSNAVYQMLLAWKMNPSAFGDEHLANGDTGKNNVPDILDEIKWGLEWLIKMNPDSGEMYNQIADDRDHAGYRLPNKDRVSYGKGLERPVYFCTGDTQGLMEYKNRATGIASTAGKFASSFALAAEVFRESDPGYSEMLLNKAIAAWRFGKANPGACQTAPCVAPYFYEEDNWVDDMELAGATIYKLTRDKSFLDEAADYGRQEIFTPWMGADTATHYQWYPFLNMGHWAVGSAENNYAGEFAGYWQKGLQNVFDKGKHNAFLNGVPKIWCSNNLTVALITQCHLYEMWTGDKRFREMEAALRDWLFGCNPWGTSMVIGLPGYGDTPVDPHSSLSVLNGYKLDGGLVDGPVYYSIFKNLKGIDVAGKDEYSEFQSHLAVYHDDNADYSTNEPTMDGTADFTYYLSAKQHEAHQAGKNQENQEISHGAIIRGRRDDKVISLVFTGHEFGNGLPRIMKTLKKNDIKASFFVTGDFYRNKKFASSIKKLINGGHYLGAHSDKHLLYCAWENRDSMLVTKDEFVADLKANYAAMVSFSVHPQKARWFLPPYEWYNDSISLWARQYGLQLINNTPGTLSAADWTYPSEGIKYSTSEEIYKNIINFESTEKDGLNGFILLTHLGTDPKRPDPFFLRLDELISTLKGRGYRFIPLDELLQK